MGSAALAETGLDLLAPGVRGYTRDRPSELWIPYIMAENEGNGDVGAYLDSLPRDRPIVIPNVINERLYKMLGRRGFVPEMRWNPMVREHVEVQVRYERLPEETTNAPS